MMNQIKWKERELQVPIIQGGMGIGISLGGLAGAVAACGGMGTISAALPGFRNPEMDRDLIGVNRDAIAEEVKRAKEISGGRGLVAVNVMAASDNYEDLVMASIDAGADAIVSGAGVPRNLPALTEGRDVLLAAVVSSARAGKVICRLWDKHYGVIPDFLILEGSDAGGHLGFDREHLAAGTCQPLEEAVRELRGELKPFEEKYDRRIPLFAAGGIRSAADAEHLLRAGADGIQLATEFMFTFECDATDAYKEIILRASDEEVRIVNSPVGMPGRAIKTPLIQRVETEGRIPPVKCRKCLKVCRPASTPYCISEALIRAYYGDYENGLFFCGTGIGQFDKLVHVRDVMEKYSPEGR